MPRTIGQGIEILAESIPTGKIRHAIFDFDGTLSLIREGWVDVMAPMMVEKLLALNTGESAEQLDRMARGFIERLTGKQTIYQMIELAQRIEERGGTAKDPLEYKHEFLQRLEERIGDRVNGLASGAIPADQLLIPGCREFLEALRQRNVTLYLASGTDEPFVKREIQLLGLADFFNGGVHGARDAYTTFSKRMLMESIARDNNLAGPELLGVGDGYVEIENTKEFGGIAVGIPSNERDPTLVDDWKRRRLTDAGADLLTPNYVEHEVLIDFLFSAV